MQARPIALPVIWRDLELLVDLEWSMVLDYQALASGAAGHDDESQIIGKRLVADMLIEGEKDPIVDGRRARTGGIVVPWS